MKRKFADRRGWARVPGPVYVQREVEGGVLAALHMPAVREALWVPLGGASVCVADAGHTWVTFLPRGARHVVTGMFDAAGDVVQWYVDIVQEWGLGDDGVPWFDDLYLDVVVSPDGSAEVFDADELDEALAAGAITAAQAERAWAETRAVLAAVAAGTFAPLAVTRAALGDLFGGPFGERFDGPPSPGLS